MAWSQSTSAAIASTNGTARGSTHGSWRPRPVSSVSSPASVTVSCGNHDRRRRLERDPEHDRLAVGDPALDAARAVASCVRDLAAVHAERVVVLAAGQPGAGEAAADLEALGRRQRKHAPWPDRPRACRTPARPARPGSPRTTHSTTPPSESPSARASSIRSIIARAAAASGAAHDVCLDLREWSPSPDRPPPRCHARDFT